MKTPDKYRFSLQWGAETAEKIQAGEMLEGLGNRKSEFIVMAVSEYIRAHPEILSNGQQLKIVVKSSFTREQIESIVRRIVEERLIDRSSDNRIAHISVGESENDEFDTSVIDAMIKNLDLFNT